MTREEALERIEFRVRRFCPEANGDNIGECNGCWRYPCNDMKAVELLAQERPHGTCKTCKHYNPYREQFSYRNRGDGYCKSTITTSEGNAYINCHDEWYCANYEKAGEKE